MSEKMQDSDFEMIQVRTPLGDIAFISKTAYDKEKDGLNFWSLLDKQSQELNIKSPINSTIKTVIKTTIKMEAKNMAKRPISEHIMTVLEVCKGKAFSFDNIKKMLSESNFNHTTGMIKDNLNILVEQKKIVKVKDCFGISVQENGKNVIAVEKGKKVETIEV